MAGKNLQNYFFSMLSIDILLTFCFKTLHPCMKMEKKYPTMKESYFLTFYGPLIE